MARKPEIDEAIIVVTSRTERHVARVRDDERARWRVSYLRTPPFSI